MKSLHLEIMLGVVNMEMVIMEFIYHILMGFPRKEIQIFPKILVKNMAMIHFVY